ncbi:MAG: zinc-dependent metalloprotease family protein [Candidatus Binatia bacterium]
MTRIGTRLLTLLTVLAWASAAAARPSQPEGSGVPDSVHYYESVAMMSSGNGQTNGAPPADGATQLSFYTLGRQFDLMLEPSDIFAQGATVTWVDDGGKVEEPADSGEFFRGRVDGEADSWVRITMEGSGVSGIIRTAHEVYFLQPAERFFGAEAAGETLAYRLSDTDSEWHPDSCAASSRTPVTARTSRSAKARAKARARRGLSSPVLAEAVAAASAGAMVRDAEIGLVGDYEYFTKYGAQSAVRMAEVLNAVDGVYQSELGVQLRVLSIIIYQSPSDPFSATLDPSALLYEFGAFRNANDNTPGQMLYGADLAHLFTGRDLNGYTIGIAFIGTLCNSSFGAGVSQDFSSALSSMLLLVAHEMGHNFGAPHDHQTGSACVNESDQFIMNPVLSPGLDQRFSPCSKNLIGNQLSGAMCLPTVLSSDPPPVPSVTINPLLSPIVVGAPLTITGTGLSPGSVLKLFVATASGTVGYGPYTPDLFTPNAITFWTLNPSIPLGAGFAAVMVVNTDQNYIESNVQGALLAGSPAFNIPTIAKINNVGLRPADASVPLATVETVVVPGSLVTITGTGFNQPLVNLFSANGNLGPLAPVSGWTSTQFQVLVPANAPTGPGSFQVVNNPYTGNVLSNAVSVPLGALVTITDIVQSGNTVTVTGSGFSTLSVINLFNNQSNIGGFGGAGPKVPLTVISSTRMTFTVPATAQTGAAYVQVLNPPFIAYSSSGNDPDGVFFMTGS